jgi:hypothetical protein
MHIPKLVGAAIKARPARNVEETIKCLFTRFELSANAT